MDDRLNIDALERLGQQFRRAVEQERNGAARRHRRLTSKWIAVALIGLCVSGTAIAGTLIVTQGDPIPSAPAGDFSADQRPLPKSSRLAGVQVADPDGGLPWGLRVADGRNGGSCYTLGRLYQGQLGVTQNGVFRVLPELGPQTCTTFTDDRPILLTISHPPIWGESRTAVHGVASARISHVVVLVEGRKLTLRPDANGAFLAVMKDDPPLITEVHYKNGRTDILDWQNHTHRTIP